MNAAEFNTRYKVGTPVVAYPLTRDDEGLVTQTRTPAWELGHGNPVVSVDGYAGGICLTHVDVREAACDWNPVQATTDCDWDRNCPVHGENPTTTAAVAALGALPMPAGPGVPETLTPAREQQIRALEPAPPGLVGLGRAGSESEQRLYGRAVELHAANRELLAEIGRLRGEWEAAPATVPAAYELATRAYLGSQLREVIDRCAKRANQADHPLRRDLIARGMGLLSALHLIEEGSADNTEQDGEFAGYDEDADPPEGFPDAPIPYSDPTDLSAATLLTRRGLTQRGGAEAGR